MTSTGDALRKADLDAGKPQVPAPPRPSGSARADVSIKTERGEKAHVDINAGGSRGASSSGWPKDADEWKRCLAKVAPWVIGAAILAAAGTAAYRKNEEEGTGTGARRKARAAGERAREAGEEAKESARRGWFGLKSRASEAADEAEDAWEDTKPAASQKGREVKEGAKGAVARAEDAARDAASAVAQKAYDAKEGAKSAASSAAESAHRAANRVEHGVAKAGSKVLEKSGAAEEQTGKALKHAGERLETDGRQTKQWAKGEEVKQEYKKRCSIM